mmetsp:Transcript_63649/g.129252  ORF Transcript_63649/g.129252 Transcript_63649/m.129252 type:complete len:350 (-) Transcript_63649:275-1324(-)
MVWVWIFRICTRPSMLGRPISTWISRRPGRSSASSIMSRRLVMPMSRMLFRLFTPSILLSNWLTTESWTPVLSRVLPRFLQMASISSKMMMCRSLFSPFSAWSASASANSWRMFSSEPPTHLLRHSGPFTIFGGRAFSASPILRAISVLPQPGGPYRSMPRAWCISSSFSRVGAAARDAKALRKMTWNSSSSPPMPISKKLKLEPTTLLACVAAMPVILSPESFLLLTATSVSGRNCPVSMSRSFPSFQHRLSMRQRICALLYLITTSWPEPKQCLLNLSERLEDSRPASMVSTRVAPTGLTVTVMWLSGLHMMRVATRISSLSAAWAVFRCGEAMWTQSLGHAGLGRA